MQANFFVNVRARVGPCTVCPPKKTIYSVTYLSLRSAPFTLSSLQRASCMNLTGKTSFFVILKCSDKAKVQHENGTNSIQGQPNTKCRIFVIKAGVDRSHFFLQRSFFFGLSILSRCDLA